VEKLVAARCVRCHRQPTDVAATNCEHCGEILPREYAETASSGWLSIPPAIRLAIWLLAILVFLSVIGFVLRTITVIRILQELHKL